MEATQSFPQQKWKPGKRRSVGEIDWIEIKSITQMLPHCNYFSKDPAEWSWNEITFYKCSPNSCLFYFSPLFFSLIQFHFCVLQGSIKDSHVRNNAQLWGSLT